MSNILNEPQIDYRGVTIEENQTRICIKCNKSKNLRDDFRFHSSSGFFTRKCKHCLNEEERNRRGSRYTIKIDISPEETKKCVLCGIDKNVVDCFYFHKGTNRYLSECKECNRKLRSERRKQGKDVNYNNRKLNSFTSENRAKRMKHSYRTYDKKRGLSTDLNHEYIEEIITNTPCSYCGYPATGLDRKDNSRGHLKENCVPCCYECNTARMDNFSHEEMLKIGKTIKEVKDSRQCSSPVNVQI